LNVTLNSELTAQGSRETYHKASGQSEAVTLDNVVPEAARELADRRVAQTREAFERSKDVLEAALETVDKSYDALGQGAAALNRKIIEIAQRNISSGFDLAKSLATAKTLAEIVELRATYWRKQFTVLAAQAEEVRALYAKVAEEMTRPIQEHVTRTFDDLRQAPYSPPSEDS
jgi:phasin